MSEISQYVKQLGCRDTAPKGIYILNKQRTDIQLANLVDCLLVHPDVVTDMFLCNNRLTNATGVKMARYMAASSTVKFMDLSFNQFGEATYLAVAAALRVNSSLCYLYLYNNQAVDQTSIDAAFVEALRLNPTRPDWSSWRLYLHGSSDADFKRLNHVAEKTTSPSMLEFLLYVHLDTEKN